MGVQAGQAEEETEVVNLMQSGAASSSRSSTGGDGGDSVTVEGRDRRSGTSSWELTEAERAELLALGWDDQMVGDLADMLDFLSELRDQGGTEAVAWAAGRWTAGGVQADVAVEAVTDVVLRRLTSCAEQYPGEYQVRGRLCVGFAGFQRQLGEFHTRFVQRCLQDAWVGPPLPNPSGPIGAALHAGTSADYLREARDQVRRGRVRGRAEVDDRGGESVEPGVDDSSSLMQLTAEEEALLEQHGVADSLRGALRELLRGLRNQEDRGEGAEFRWGVNLVLDATDVARSSCGVVEEILRARTLPSSSMRCWPSQRIPPFGPLRSRIGEYMDQYRHLLVSTFDRELGRALRELVGCPEAGEVHGPTLERTRTVPRGSRSRSRTPPPSSSSRGDLLAAVPARAPRQLRPGEGPSGETNLGEGPEDSGLVGPVGGVPVPLGTNTAELLPGLPVRASPALPAQVSQGCPLSVRAQGADEGSPVLPVPGVPVVGNADGAESLPSTMENAPGPGMAAVELLSAGPVQALPALPAQAPGGRQFPVRAPGAAEGSSVLPVPGGVPVVGDTAGDGPPALPAGGVVNTVSGATTGVNLPVVVSVSAFEEMGGLPVLPTAPTESALGSGVVVADGTSVGDEEASVGSSLRPALPARTPGADDGSPVLPVLHGVSALALSATGTLQSASEVDDVNTERGGS